MKGRDRALEELFAPLADKYDPSLEDRRRVLRNLRALTAAPAPRPASAAPRAWRRWAWGCAGAAVLAAAAHTLLGDRRGTVMPAEEPARVAAPSPAPVVTGPDATGWSSASTVETAANVVTISVDALPSAVTASPPSSRPGPGLSTDDDALTRETRLWGEAHRASTERNLPEALRLLDVHAQAFPRGVLADERAIERIIVLCRMGRRTDAVRDARGFLAAHGKSPLRDRLRATCAEEPGLAADQDGAPSPGDAR
jgi:hypothetical protein